MIHIVPFFLILIPFLSGTVSAEHVSADSRALQYQAEKQIENEQWFSARETVRELTRHANSDMQSHYQIKEIEITLLRLNYVLDGFRLIRHYTELYWDNYHVLHQILQIPYSRKNITAHIHPELRRSLTEPIVERILQLVHALGEKFAQDRAFTYAPALAQFYFENGNKAEAIQMCENGINSLNSLSPSLRTVILPGFLKLLADYQDKEVCRDGFCAKPPPRWKTKPECETKLFTRP